MKQLIRKIFISSSCAILLIAGLYYLVVLNHSIRNGFNRKFKSAPVIISGSIDLKYNSYYIAGLTSSTIYLGNYSSPHHFMKTDYVLKDTQHIQQRFLDGSAFGMGNAFQLVSGKLCLIDKSRSSIMLTGLPENDHSKDDRSFSKLHNILISNWVPISTSTFALVTYDTHSHQNVLVKESPPFLPVTTSTLEKQLDGFFCTSGILLAQGNRVIYIYTFRNQFIVMDTNLIAIYKAGTIDTTNQVKIEVTDLPAQKRSMLSGVPVVVNKMACVSDGRLYISSGIKADNEAPHIRSNAASIDVYSLGDGHYLYSFPLYHFRGKPVSNFRIMGNRLVAIFDHWLVIFRLEYS